MRFTLNPQAAGLLRARQKLAVAAEVGKTKASAPQQTSKTRLYWEVPASLVSWIVAGFSIPISPNISVLKTWEDYAQNHVKTMTIHLDLFKKKNV